MKRSTLDQVFYMHYFSLLQRAQKEILSSCFTDLKNCSKRLDKMPKVTQTAKGKAENLQ